METPDKSSSKRQQDIWFSCGAVKTMPEGVCRHIGFDSCGNVRADTSPTPCPAAGTGTLRFCQTADAGPGFCRIGQRLNRVEWKTDFVLEAQKSLRYVLQAFAGDRHNG